MEFPSEKDEKLYKKAKKSIRATRIAFLIFIAASIALGFFANEAFWALALVLVLGSLFVVSKSKKQLKRSFCSSCHAHYDYEKDVEWQVTNEVVSSTQNSAQRKANVEFICHCPNCGKERIFDEKFVVASVDSKGIVRENNIQSMAKKYFF